MQLSQEQQQREAIIDWLSPLDFWTKQDDIFNRHQEGTGQWLLYSDEFRNWLSGTGNTLWCPGIRMFILLITWKLRVTNWSWVAGAGKTVLAYELILNIAVELRLTRACGNRSIVVDHLHEKFKDETDVGIACIYCNYKEKNMQTPVNLIAGVWSQLIQQHEPLSNDVQDLYKSHSRHNTRPTLGEVSKILKSDTGRYSRIFVVVDALDECPEDTGSRESLLKELRALQPILNLIVTSRFIDTIAREFNGMIQLEIRANDEDIQAYTRARISREHKLLRNVGKDVALREDIVKTVVRNAEKMYDVPRHNIDQLRILESSMC